MGRIVPNLSGITTSGALITKVEADAKYLIKAGDTMTGSLAFATSNIGIVRKDGSGASWRDGAAIDGAITTTQI